MKIRRATEKDFKVLSYLEFLLLKYLKQFSNEIKPVKYRAKFDKELKGVFNKPNFFFFIINDNKDDIGFINFCVTKDMVSERGSIYINDIFVKAEYRHSGAGKSLINEAIKIAKRKKLNKLSLGSRIQNKLAIKFYEHLGFTKTHIEFEKKI